MVSVVLRRGRLAAGKVAPALEEVSLAALLHDTLAWLGPQARAKGLEDPASCSVQRAPAE